MQINVFWGSYFRFRVIKKTIIKQPAYYLLRFFVGVMPLNFLKLR